MCPPYLLFCTNIILNNAIPLIERHHTPQPQPKSLQPLVQISPPPCARESFSYFPRTKLILIAEAGALMRRFSDAGGRRRRPCCIFINATLSWIKSFRFTGVSGVVVVQENAITFPTCRVANPVVKHVLTWRHFFFRCETPPELWARIYHIYVCVCDTVVFPRFLKGSVFFAWKMNCGRG